MTLINFWGLDFSPRKMRPGCSMGSSHRITPFYLVESCGQNAIPGSSQKIAGVSIFLVSVMNEELTEQAGAGMRFA